MQCAAILQPKCTYTCARRAGCFRTLPKTGQLRLQTIIQQCRAEADKSSVSATDEPQAASSAPKEPEPIWVQRERARELAKQKGPSIPFGVYLLGSIIVAIATVGSMFEYSARNPLFGVVSPDNPIWAPILLTFAITGIPSAGFLFYKAVSEANKASEEMDAMDGYK